MAGSASSLTRPHLGAPIEFLRARWLLLAGAVLLVVLPSLFATTSKIGEWDDCYWLKARQMRAGEPIHDARMFYTYPPAMAFFSIPLATDSPVTSRVLWGLVNVAAVGVLVVCGARLAGADHLTKLSAAWSTVLASALLLCGRWLASPLQHLQYDAVIAALLAAGCLALTRGRDLRAGLLVGLAASMKLTPLLFVPYLLWRARLRAAAAALVVAVGVNFLPDLCFPQRSGASYFADWYRQFLAGTLGGTPGAWHTAIHLNQSLAGFFNRMAGIVTSGSTENLTFVSFDEATRAAVKGLNYGAAAVLLGVTLWIGRRPFSGPIDDRRASTDGGASSAGVNPFWSLEFGMLLALMVLLSPMSGKAHYVVLWLPTLLVARGVQERPTLGGRAAIALLLLSGLLGAKEILGSRLGDATLIWGLPTLYPLVLLAAMWSRHASRRRAAEQADATVAVPHFQRPLLTPPQPQRRKAG